MARIYPGRICLSCGKAFAPVGTRDVWCSVECRFWFHVDKTAGPDDCWPWKLGVYQCGGYGQFCVGKKHFYAHRLCLQFSGVVIPSDHYACHECDNPPCCNPHPKHVIVATPTDNVKHMYQLGRQGERNYATGERHGRHTKPEAWGK